MRNYNTQYHSTNRNFMHMLFTYYYCIRNPLATLQDLSPGLYRPYLSNGR